MFFFNYINVLSITTVYARLFTDSVHLFPVANNMNFPVTNFNSDLRKINT